MRFSCCLCSLLALFLGGTVAGCGPSLSASGRPATVAPSTAAPVTPMLPPSTTAEQPVRVVLIVMENHSYDAVVGLPYVRTLVSTGTALTDYHAISHPSLPNYLALTSGSTWGITDDGYHALPALDVGDQLTGASLPWRAYMEGMGSDCHQSTGGYAVKHDPFAYYGGGCPAAVVPFSQLSIDLATPAPPRFMWITPDLCHDMHDCSSEEGDRWLSGTVPVLLAAPSMRNGVVFITWDEGGSGGTNRVLTLVLGSRAATTPGATYTHAALLATVEDLLGLPRLPAARSATAIALH